MCRYLKGTREEQASIKGCDEMQVINACVNLTRHFVLNEFSESVRNVVKNLSER